MIIDPLSDPPSPEPAQPESIPVILLHLLPEMLWLVLLVAIPILVPLPWATGYWLAFPFVRWLQKRWTGAIGERLDQAATASCFGLGFAVCRAVPGPIFSVLAGLATILAALGLQIWIEQLLGLSAPRANQPEPAQGPAPASAYRITASAWGGPAPVAPDGETIRLLESLEIAMGGPVVCDYLFADGSVIRGAGASCGFSPDGRYFLSPMPSRDHWRMLLFDRHEHLLYRCDAIDGLWEIDAVSETEVFGRVSPLISNSAAVVAIETLKQQSKAEHFVAVQDLLIPTGDWAQMPASTARLTAEVPDGGPSLDIRPEWPTSLSDLRNPLEALYQPVGELCVDGAASGVLVGWTNFTPLWRADTRAFACLGRRRGDAERGIWLWEADRGWRPLSSALPMNDVRPYAGDRHLDTLDPDWLRLRWTLSQPRLSYGDHGTIGSFDLAALHLVTGEDEAGGGPTVESPTPMLWQAIALDRPGKQQHLESAELTTGDRVEWRWLGWTSNRNGPVFACRIGDWTLDGEWVLDHRIATDCNRVALIAYAPPPAAAHRIAIIDVAARRLDWVEGTILDPWLQGFVGDRLHFVTLRGRTHHVSPGRRSGNDLSLLRRFDEISPSPDRADAFMAPREDSRLYYEQAHAEPDTMGWRMR